MMRLRKIRQEKGLSQRRLAMLADMDANIVNRIELDPVWWTPLYFA